MAEISPFVDSSSPQYARQFNIETIGGDQKKRLAEMLRGQMFNQPQGQMVSGWYVAPSWSQQMVPALAGVLGTYLGKESDEDLAKKTAAALDRFKGVKEEIPLNKAIQSNASQAEGQTPFAGQQTLSQRFAGNAQPSAEQTPMNPEMAPRQTRMRPLTQDEQDMALMNLANVNPQIANIYGGLLSARATREQKRQDAIELEKLRQEGRLDNLRMAAMLRPAPAEKMITAIDESGNPFTIPQSQFQPGMTIYNPTTAKAFKERQEKAKGLENLNDLTGSLRQAYGNLNQMNAIPSTQNRIGTNIGAKLASTGVGQWLGGAVGTDAQAERDKIAQTRPLLLNAIKNATGMSAKQMDSNAELNMYLRAATDPSLTYEANMEALNNLDRLYGLGLNGGTPQSAVSAPPPGAVREKK